MFYQMKAKRDGWILTVTTCPSFGMRPQVEISKTQIKKNGGLEKVQTMANEQSQKANRPIAFIDHNGQIIFKSDNWPS